jgi:1-acyl-sn-glycerol-3-phosphate acyltransferase
MPPLAAVVAFWATRTAALRTEGHHELMQWMQWSLVSSTSQMYVAMLVIALAFFPWALVFAAGRLMACHTYCRWVIWTAGWMVGLRSEVRGTPPDGRGDDRGQAPVLPRHHADLHAVPRGKFIMKRELMLAPVRASTPCASAACRSTGASAARRSPRCWRCRGGLAKPRPADHLSAGHPRAPGGEGPTRSARAFFTGAWQPCVPVATNVGVFWPKRGSCANPV